MFGSSQNKQGAWNAKFTDRNNRLFQNSDSAQQENVQQVHTPPAFLQNTQLKSEEEEVQTKEAPVQKLAEEDEMQQKAEPIQAKNEDEEIKQGKFHTNIPAYLLPVQLKSEEEEIQAKTTQEQAKANNTGLPDNVKSGVENLSGVSMDDVQVHYNSAKPAQLQAHAYTQGADIHVAPGQEQHVAHEAWHVVQQKQGRVQPTKQLKGEKVNDNEGLEKEADVMGGKAVQMKKEYVSTIDNSSFISSNINQLQSASGIVIQREFNDDETVTWDRDKLSRLWRKLKGKPGTREDCPNYGTVDGTLRGLYDGQAYTERELAEEIIKHSNYKDYFRDNRMHTNLPDQNTVDFGEDTDEEVRDKIIRKAIRNCMYYHATQTRYTEDILDKGLKASKGGQGEGISTHGRADMAEGAAQTYNDWSRKHTFITKDIGEATGYRNSMAQNSGQACEIIRVFSTPSFTAEEFNTDIDSNHGLKYKGDMTGIGLADGRINNMAQTVVLAALKELPAIDGRDIDFTKGDIVRVYQAM